MNSKVSKKLLFLFKKIVSLLPHPQEKTLQELAHQARPPYSFSLPQPQGPLEEGRLHFQQGRFAESLSCFSIAIQRDPHNNWAWHGQGDSFQLLGDYVCAQEAYEQAILLSPNTGLHHAGLCNALVAQNNENEAQKAWKKALQLDSSLTWMQPKFR